MSAYDPNDPTQQGFLSALAAGESGSSSNPYSVGYGGVNLSGYATDKYGFPQWSGVSTSQGPTHAAGAFQFQPGTWATIAQRYNLNFQSPADQNAGAWYLAQDTYLQKTGHDLTADLQAGNYGSINSALQGQWSSTVSGPDGGLAQRIAAGAGAELAPGSSGSTGTLAGLVSDPIGTISQYFVRGGMVLVGIIIVGIALYALLVHQNIAPSPKEIAGAVT